MVTSNFYITAFISLPISVAIVVMGIIIVASPDRANRVSRRSYVLLSFALLLWFGIDALRTMSTVTSTHATFLMIVGANFWAASLLYLASGVRHELETRSEARTELAIETNTPHVVPR